MERSLTRVRQEAGDFRRGVSYLGRGFELLRSRPRLYLIGIIPALVVFVVLAAAFVVLLVHLDDVVAWLTPFADGWYDLLRRILRIGLGIVVVLGAVILWSATFTGLTLTLGDPFYEHIWKQTEQMLGPEPLGDGLGFWDSVRDGLVLTAIGLATSLLVLVSGFIPVIGPFLGIALGVTLSGRILARELVSRALEGRGMRAAEQKALLAPHRRTVLGFGVVTQACFLIPLGGVLVMPAAVAGATALARDVLPPPHLRATKVRR
ncbi:EI24 domain-containing protein [Nocardioides sp.]|uniref:EI24 domain-containing protein n=1 Tax=Nocardioides sp. TaxID=35761 RepID=UPI0035151D30